MHQLLSCLNNYIRLYKWYTLYGVNKIVCHIYVYVTPHNIAFILWVVNECSILPVSLRVMV